MSLPLLRMPNCELFYSVCDGQLVEEFLEVLGYGDG